MSSSSSPPLTPAITTRTSTLPVSTLSLLSSKLLISEPCLIFLATALVHYRYTGLQECDVKLRLSDLVKGDTFPDISLVLKNTLTLATLLDTAEKTLKKSVGASAVTSLTQTKYHLNLEQMMSAELASSGFQHILHVEVESLGGGSGSGNGSPVERADVTVKYTYPTLKTPGQADPRTRCHEHLPGMLQGLLDLLSTPTGKDTPIHLIQFLSANERATLLHEWSGLTTYDSVDPSDQLLQEMFEATSAKFPDRIAIECHAPTFRNMTYAQMSRRTNQLARWMRNNEVDVGKYVGMWLPRGMEVYIALISILKAGAAYVPIDPEYPSDRVNFILDDCKAPILITHSELIAEHPDFVLPPGCKMICYDQVDSLMEEQDATFPTREQTGQKNSDVCYVIYTSGSTGRPKGCCLEHRSAVNLVRAEKVLFGVHELDRVYQGFSIAFDASVEEVWLAFASGAALVAATPDMLHAGPALPKMLNAQQITIVSTVPTLLSMMEDTLPNVRLLISGGEAVQKDIIVRWGSTRRFVNTYGPTEATVIATHVDTDPLAPLVTIGKPVPSYFVYILDANLNICPIGVGGELHIGGICVARGYLGRDELTREKFIQYPKSKLWCKSEDEPELQLISSRSPRLYKAGDLCRWTEGGEIEFCGRIDAQVKLRGYRVELSEIESVLMTQDNIQSACVSVREDVPGIQNLIGYVILKDKSLTDCFDQDALKESIRVRLPPYMVPAAIDVLTKFPTLPSGKVNRKELPPPKNLVVMNFDDEEETDGAAGGDGAEEEKADGGAAIGAKGAEEEKKSSSSSAAVSSSPPADLPDGYYPPRSPLERKLASLWRKLFQRKHISSTDDFFTLGGHSLLAAWLVSALRKDKSTEHVTMADIYGFTTLREMAWKLEGKDASDLPTVEEEDRLFKEAQEKKKNAASAASSGKEESKEEQEAAALLAEQEAAASAAEDDDASSIDSSLLPSSNPSSSSANSASTAASRTAAAAFSAVTNTRFLICGFAQLLSLYLLFTLPSLLVGVPWNLFLMIRSQGWIYILIMLLPFSIAIFPLYVILAILMKWLLIGRYKTGKYPLFGWFYFRWWLVQRLITYIPLIYLRGTPMLTWYFRLMGAKIGKCVFLNTHHIDAPDLVEIGDDTSIGIDAQIINFHVEGGWLIIRASRIGKCCYVGTRGVISGGSVMCDHSQLGSMSALTQGTIVPAWEHWRGSPARYVARVENFLPKYVRKGDKLVQQRRRRKLSSTVEKGQKASDVYSQLPSSPHISRGEHNNQKNQKLLKGAKNALGRHSPSIQSSASFRPEHSEQLYDQDQDEHEVREEDDDLALVNSNNGHANHATSERLFPDGRENHMKDSLLDNDTENSLAPYSTHNHNGESSVYIGVHDDDSTFPWRVSRPSRLRRVLLGIGQSIVLTCLIPVMFLISIFPGVYVLHRLLPRAVDMGSNLTIQDPSTWKYVMGSFPIALSFFILLPWQITIMKWVLVGQIQPGDYSIYSWFYFRKWTVDTLMQLSIQILRPLYGTSFITVWFRWLGAIIGERVEIATALYVAPDLIELGNETFIADSVYLGVPAVHMATIRLGKIVLGHRVFIGNGACLPMQTMIGHQSLVGVMSAPPLAHDIGVVAAAAARNGVAGGAVSPTAVSVTVMPNTGAVPSNIAAELTPSPSSSALSNGATSIDTSANQMPLIHWPEPALRCSTNTAWLGNPAIFLPNRQKPYNSFTELTTYRPSFYLRFMRIVFEIAKITFPMFLFLISMLLLIGDFHFFRTRFAHTWSFWLVWPLLYMIAGALCCFVTLMIKWLFVGKYMSGEYPLWSTFIWSHDLVTSLLESLVHPYFISNLRGTPFVSIWFRLLGAQIGSRVWMDTCAITEPDLVSIGDDSAIHDDAQLQTHLFEDRICKMSHLEVGKKCSIGNSSVVLYDSIMHEGANLLPLSLLMKGETLPPWSSWQGVPAHSTHSWGLSAPIETERMTAEEMAGIR